MDCTTDGQGIGMGVKLGIIGGSGLYALPGLAQGVWRQVETPWGAPSDALLSGTLAGIDAVFLPRHGRGHGLLPSELNFRANIAALRLSGCTHLLSLSACGSFREAMAPGDFVLVDQFIDRTTGRARTFFGSGIVGHVAMADPVSAPFLATAARAAGDCAIPVHSGGTYLCIDGPQFSTRAESRLYRSWGGDVIGMTNLPEAYLAREAGLIYLPVAMVTDYDSWRLDSAGVEAADILSVLSGNSAKAQALVTALAARLAAGEAADDPACTGALVQAIITAPAQWPAATASALDAIRLPADSREGASR